MSTTPPPVGSATTTDQTPTASQIRAELERLVIADLLGPANGPDEIVEEPSVRGRYMLGVLAPKGQTALRTEEEELDEDQVELGEGAETVADPEDTSSDLRPPKAVSMMPSAIGLSCTVDGAATALQITASWGRYARTDHPDPEKRTKAGQRIRVWQRQPQTGSTTVPLQTGNFGPLFPVPDHPGVTVRGRVRRRDDEWSVTVYLINDQIEPKAGGGGKDSAWLFQPQLSLAALDGAPIFCQRPRLGDPADSDPEELAMQMIYRHQVEFAVGHGVAVHAELAPGEWARATRLTTQVTPGYEVGRTTPPTAADIPALASVALDMQQLATLADAEFATALSPLATAYAQWIDEQAARANHPPPDLAHYQAAALTAVANARQTLARIEEGINLLVSNPQAAAAFRFANQAMWQQRIHSLYAQQRSQGKEIKLEDVDRPQNRRWYPFQLAFILLNLPSLTNIHHSDRSHPTEAIADLLWFPTGGGKTEAYLGLTAYTLGLRRLQGEVDGYSGHAGVAVLMRYTLRLLTLQQFQRATALICACEQIRQEAQAAGDARWGVEPFRIGLWVGSRSTPNTTDASAEALNKGGSYFASASGTPYQLTYCPWCGSEIKEGRDLHVEAASAGRGRTFTYCGDPLGKCLFSRKQSPDEGLPVLVVDEEIYRRLPALLIATVDKFAQMPWKGATQMLFGRVDSYCPRHGYGSPELICATSHRATHRLPATRTETIGPLRPPDLIIQDELHLISGPLGTLVGLYETAIDALCSWPAHGQTVRPKVVASTATIRRAGAQVSRLYLRSLNIFPPAGIDAEDNFFARQRPPSLELPGRRYVGICAPGNRVKSLLIRMYVAVLGAAQKLYDQYGAAADPYMTLVGYFNAVRELGGMRRAADDAVRTRLRQAHERGLARRYLEHYGVEELTSRKSAADIPQILRQLESQFVPGGKRSDQLDIVLATNMISVGVDVSRLGLMVVAGQPKTTAEYIQSTSRVGRQHPGLVFVVYNWARPRDLSHYEHFAHYHATFYQHVEPLSVTPFSPRALDRGLTGVMVALIRLREPQFNDNLGAARITRDHPIVQATLAEISRRAGLVEGEQGVESQVREELVERLDEWLYAQQRATGGARLGYEKTDGTIVNLLKRAEGNLWDHFVCLNSLRDVEPSVGLILDDSGMEARTLPFSATTAPEEGAGA